MKITMFCGKGGVGKTTSAVSFGLFLASQGKKTAIIDYDGGHSVKNTLGVSGDFPPNTLHEIRPNLFIAINEPCPYKSILDSKKLGMRFSEYLRQFLGDSGIVALADMINDFFGVPTDVPTLQKFTKLVSLLCKLEEENFDHIIIDVEPTAGLQRLLSNAEATIRSLKNLQGKGKLSLMAISAKWPDISAFLQSSYIRRADFYSDRLDKAVGMIKYAEYLIVATPEAGPIQQTFEVRKIIEEFGGRVHSYIVNNIRGEEEIEGPNIEILYSEKLSVIEVRRERELHIDHIDRIPILTRIGKTIAASFT